MTDEIRRRAMEILDANPELSAREALNMARVEIGLRAIK